jgi:hypothetical protein
MLSMLIAFPPGSSSGGFSESAAQRESEMHQPPANSRSATNRVKPGMWGGEHISLHVAEREARVEFDCAHATITQSITHGRRGRFSVAGIYVEEHGGAVRESKHADSYPVRFDGRVDGQTMKLSVTRTTGDKEVIGTFTLVYNQEPFLVKCR